MSEIRDSPPFPFFLGCGRSGTTLVRLMFRAHPQLAMVPEHHFPAVPPARWIMPDGGLNVSRATKRIASARWFARFGIEPDRFRSAVVASDATTYADVIRCLYSLYAHREGKPRYGNKTPGHVRSIPQLAAQFPEAHFVHIVRDGRDVALSYLERDFGPADLPSAARFWQDRVMGGRTAGDQLGSQRYCELRYEDLITDTKSELERLCAFLDLEYDDAMLRYHERGPGRLLKRDPQGHLYKPPTRGLRDWRAQMTRDELILFESIAGQTLDAFGYERAPVRASLRERAKAHLGDTSSRLEARVHRGRKRAVIASRRLRRA